MKKEKQTEARVLRSNGMSVKEIAKILKVSASSVSLWVRNVPLTFDQRDEIKSRASVRTIEATKKHNANKYAPAIKQADKEWESLRHDPTFMFGLALYIGEGSKTDGRVGITNSNPPVLKRAKQFLTWLSGSVSKLRVQVIIHEGEDPQKAVAFWSSYLDIPTTQFNRVSALKKSGGARKRKMPHGVAHIKFNSMEQKQKLNRWMERALQG